MLEALATLATAVVAVEVGLRLLYGRLGFREALFVLVLAIEFYRPLRGLGAAFHAGMAGEEGAPRLLAILEAPTALARPAAARPVPAPPLPVVFEDVGYAYAMGGAPALDGVSLRLEADRVVPLVGPSGAGKTTLASLLLGFLAPGSGRISVAGTPLVELDPEAWRRQVAWVPQRPHAFHGSVLDNLRLARPEATPAEVEAVDVNEGPPLVAAIYCDTPLHGRLSGRQIPVELPPAARSILGSLRCDLVEDEDVEAAWLGTLADAPRPGRVRTDVASLAPRGRSVHVVA